MRSRTDGPITLMIMVGLAMFAAGCRPVTARADGGTLRVWKQHGAYDIAVFTDPSPVVTGPVDISVLILDRETGEPIEEARVTVDVWPVGQPARTSSHPATRQAATNKLLRAAVFELREKGPSQINVRIVGPDDQIQIPFKVDVGEPWSPRTGDWPWILWPLPVILLYATHRQLVKNRIARSQFKKSDGS